MARKVRFSIPMTPEVRKKWKKFMVEIGTDSSVEAMMLLMDLYKACSEKYGESDIRELIRKIRTPYSVL